MSGTKNGAPIRLVPDDLGGAKAHLMTATVAATVAAACDRWLAARGLAATETPGQVNAREVKTARAKGESLKAKDESADAAAGSSPLALSPSPLALTPEAAQ